MPPCVGSRCSSSWYWPLTACGGGRQRGNGGRRRRARVGRCVCAAAHRPPGGDLTTRGAHGLRDPAYPPQSKYLPRRTSTSASTSTSPPRSPTGSGVDIAWETPSWDVITAGSWNGRWDISVGSMTPTNDRQEVLDFTEPYYYTPAVAMVHADNTTVSDLTADLDGKNIGVCAGCTYEQYLDKYARHRGLHVRLRHRRRHDQGLRHRHHRAAGPRAR